MLPQPTFLPTGDEQLADPVTRHSVYSALLGELKLSNAHEQELLRCGLSPEQIARFRDDLQYRSLERGGRARVVAKLIEAGLEEHLPSVPGFIVKEWEDGRPHWTLMGSPGLMIPVRDDKGRIVAIRIRRDETSKERYRWLTSRTKQTRKGVSPGAPPHVSIAAEWNGTVRVTECPLAADIAALVSKVQTIALPNGNSWSRAAEILRSLGASRVLLAVDADCRRNPAFASALGTLLRELPHQGIEVAVEAWDEADKEGIADVLLCGETVQVIEGNELEAWISGVIAAAGKPSDTEVGGRVRIEVTADQHLVIAQAIDALAPDETIFQRAGELVHIVRERTGTEDDGIERSAGTPRIRPVSKGLLRERLSAQCWFHKTSRGENGGEFQCPPPGFVVSAIHDRGFWEPIRTLSGITETPLLRADGTILSTPGWDEQTGLFYAPGGAIPEVPVNPDWAAATAPAELLLEVVEDFPFAAEAHRAAWLAALLTTLARRSFPGPSPLFLVDANVRGSGKSLLTDVIGIIVSGREMPRFSNPRDDEEARKRITSLALAGDPLVLIDNIGSTLGSASLDAALTSTIWKDRHLGTNTLVECPLRPLWMATGNNVILIGDTPRRVCHIRLESPLEAPEERDDFRCPNLLAHVRKHRLELLTAGLTILRAFFVAGRPNAHLKPWGQLRWLVWPDSQCHRLARASRSGIDPQRTRGSVRPGRVSPAVAVRGLGGN